MSNTNQATLKDNTNKATLQKDTDKKKTTNNQPTLKKVKENFPLLRLSKTKNNITPIEVMIEYELDKSIKNKTGNGFSEFDVFSKEDSEFNQKRLALSQLYNELIEDLINILDSKLNNAISLDDKKRYFLLFVWKLKKTLLIINSVNILKVKNNLF